MKYYDIELIDISESVENFKFTKVSEEQLNKTVETLKTENQIVFEFTSNEGNAVFLTKFFRGILYTEHQEPEKTITQENEEAAKEIAPVHIKRKVKVRD